MPFVRIKMELGAGNVFGQPATMRERNHPILPTLPDRDRPLDRTKIEAPGADKGEVVVAPTGNATGDRTPEGFSEHLREFSGERAFVDIRNQRSQGLGDVRTLEVFQFFGQFLQ